MANKSSAKVFFLLMTLGYQGGQDQGPFHPGRRQDGWTGQYLWTGR